MLDHSLLGRGDRTVLLCHGFLGSREIWNAVIPDLEGQYKLLLPDLPGHGRSSAISNVHSMALMADKLAELMDAREIDMVDFVGHSMGGYVGLAFLEKYPERTRSLCLVNSTCKADDEERKVNRLRAIVLAKRSRDAYVRATIRGLFPNGFQNGDGPLIEEAIRIGLQTPIEGIAAALAGMRERQDRCALLSAEVPVFFVAGKSDPVLPWEQLKPIHAMLPEERQWIYQGGHMSMFEDAQGLSRNLLRFLA